MATFRANESSPARFCLGGPHLTSPARPATAPGRDVGGCSTVKLPSVLEAALLSTPTFSPPLARSRAARPLSPLPAVRTNGADLFAPAPTPFKPGLDWLQPSYVAPPSSPDVPRSAVDPLDALLAHRPPLLKIAELSPAGKRRLNWPEWQQELALFTDEEILAAGPQPQSPRYTWDVKDEPGDVFDPRAPDLMRSAPASGALHTSRGAAARSHPYSLAASTSTVVDPRNSPSRSLPTAARKEMQAWLEANLSHPYPSEAEKRRLAAVHDLTMTQICNWFLNARRRGKTGKQIQARKAAAAASMHRR